MTRVTRIRRDVQGMRAVAVISVIAAHAGVSFLAGGFVGVDVFFVISGFLITGLLVADAGATGRVSFSGFYARRARRILPAATLVLVVTLVASMVLVSFLEVRDLVVDAVWSALFAANLHFAAIGTDYFAQGRAPSPFQHYWSLSVEEQFYLLWPVLIALALLVTARRRPDRGVPRRLLLGGILVLSACSLAWSIHETAAVPAAAYFSSLTRAWELGLGAATALAVPRLARLRPRWVREVLAWGGLAMIAAAILAYDDTTAFPGYAALLPVLGAVAVLAAGCGDTEPPTWAARTIGVLPMRRIGDWSYSLYLWHWPLLVLPVLHLGRPLRPAETAAAVGAAVVAAYLSFRFVETPFRTGATWRTQRRALVLIPVSLAVVGLVAGAGWTYTGIRGGEHGHRPPVTVTAFGVPDPQDYPLGADPTEALVEASVIAAQHHMAVPSDLTPDLLDARGSVADVGDCDYSKNVRRLCAHGDPDATRTLVVIGDSHARAWIPAFDRIAADDGYRAFYLVKPQCTAAFVDPARAGDGHHWPECDDFHDWVTSELTRLHPDLVVVSTSSLPPSAGIYEDGDRVRNGSLLRVAMAVGYADMLRTWAPLSGRLVVLGDVPELPVDPVACLADAHDLGDCLFAPTAVSIPFDGLQHEAADTASVPWIDPEPWFCHDRLCPAVVGSTIAYRDPGHITTTRAAELAPDLGRALRLS